MSRNRIAAVLVCAAAAIACSSKQDGGTVVGAAGGTVTSASGIVLDIPAGALSGDVAIRITETNDSPPASSRPVSKLIRFEPEGLTFAKAAQVTLKLPLGVDAASIYWSRADGVGWEPLETYLGPTAGTVVAFTRHFSTAFGGEPVGAPGLVWRGAWDGGTAYAVRDVVESAGSSYVAVADSIGDGPPSAAWNLLAARGAAGVTGAPGQIGRASCRERV